MPPPEVTYVALLPFTGPEIGRVLTDSESVKWVAIRCGHDPALGEPLLAAFIPVKRMAEKWEPVDASGARKDLVSVAWVQGTGPVVEGQFTIDAPVERWRGVEGVLVVLVYEQPEGPPSDVTVQGRYRSPRKGLVPRKPTRIMDLDPGIAAGTRSRLNELLGRQDPDKLEDAVTSGVR